MSYKIKAETPGLLVLRYYRITFGGDELVKQEEISIDSPREISLDAHGYRPLWEPRRGRDMGSFFSAEFNGQSIEIIKEAPPGVERTITSR